MTIVLAGWCQSWAVLAADRLVSSPTMADEYHRKLVVHPTLPIAVATMGLSTFLDPTAVASVPDEEHGRLSTTHVQAVLESAVPTYAGSTKARDVAEHFAALLHPAYLAITRVKELDPDMKDGRIRLVVVAAHEGEVDASMVRLGRNIDAPARPELLCWGAPDCTQRAIAAYFKNPLQHGDLERMQSMLYEAYSVACTAEAIALEAAETERRTIGGPLDLAVVDADGARFFEPKPAPING